MKWTKYCKLVLIIGSRVKNMDCLSSPVGCPRRNCLVSSLSGHLVSSGRKVPLKACLTGRFCHSNREAITKTTTRTTSHRTTGPPPPCHSAATWPQDHDDNHARTCSIKWCSLQAKLARTSLRLTTLRSGESSSLYTPWPQTLYKSSQGTHLGNPTLIHSFSIVEGLLKLSFGQPVP
jgi:hypothetical protein